MKKYVYLILILLVTCVTASAKKPKPVIKWSLEVTNELSDKAKLITFECRASEYYDRFISSFHINNETDERVFIEWENARVDNSRIVFGDDNRLTMKNPKADEAVSPHSSSISRQITGERFVYSDFMLPLYRPKDLKKDLGSKNYRDVKIPIRYSDGKVVEYELKFAVWYEIPTNE